MFLSLSTHTQALRHLVMLTSPPLHPFLFTAFFIVHRYRVRFSLATRHIQRSIPGMPRDQRRQPSRKRSPSPRRSRERERSRRNRRRARSVTPSTRSRSGSHSTVTSTSSPPSQRRRRDAHRSSKSRHVSRAPARADPRVPEPYHIQTPSPDATQDQIRNFWVLFFRMNPQAFCNCYSMIRDGYAVELCPSLRLSLCGPEEVLSRHLGYEHDTDITVKPIAPAAAAAPTAAPPPAPIPPPAPLPPGPPPIPYGHRDALPPFHLPPRDPAPPSTSTQTDLTVNPRTPLFFDSFVCTPEGFCDSIIVPSSCTLSPDLLYMTIESYPSRPLCFPRPPRLRHIPDINHPNTTSVDV